MFKAKVIVNEIKKYHPEILSICKEALKENLFDLDFERIDKNIFSKCLDISIDNAVMENTKKGMVLPLDVGWSDIGSWESVWDISNKNKDGNVIQEK